MKSPKLQPNVTQPLPKGTEPRAFSQRAIEIRTHQSQNWVADTVRNYTSTIERDMDYKQSNQPYYKNSRTRLPVGVQSYARQ